MEDVAALIERTEQRRQRVNGLLDPSERVRLGQFFTPAGAAELIASLPARSGLRRSLAAEGVECPNLYSAFLAVAAMSLRRGGQLVSITPRSFANGPYFAGFRRHFLDRVSLDRVHVFESRSTVFSDSKVLQENVIISATRGGETDHVLLTSSTGHRDDVRGRAVPYHRVVRPTDRDQVVHFEVNDEDTSAGQLMSALPCTLEGLGLQVSTGRVVDFRAREHLRDSPGTATAPLIYPGNLRDGGVRWPAHIKKPQAIAMTAATTKLLLPSERFILVKRFSSKEEKRRVVAAIYEPDDVPATAVGFENHLNYFHCRNRGLDHDLATGLCLWLNSSLVDRNFRTFSGHTQVNATDLRAMRFPAVAQLRELGSSLGRSHWPDQDKIDSMVDTKVLRTTTPRTME